MSHIHPTESTRPPSPAVSPAWERRAAAVIAAASLLLMIGFSLGPISESPDEWAHYTFTRYLIENRSLPSPVERPFIQAHQAPLYYVAGIPFLLALDSDQVIVPPKNPWGGYSLDEVGNDNKNIRLHSRAEDFPYTHSPVAMAIHVTRLLSILMGIGTVVTCYFIFRLLWPGNPALRLAALGFVAFWPQFLWLSSVLNNDNLLNLMSTVTLLALLGINRDGLTLRNGLLLGVLFGLALISKASTVFLAFPIGVVLLFNWKQWRYGVISMALAALLGVWWYVRNLLTIRTLSGWPAGPEHGGLLPGQSLLAVAWDRLPFVYQGFWARFGQVDIPVDPAIYTLFDILLIASLAGLVVWLTRAGKSFDQANWNTPQNRAFAIMAVFAIAWMAGVVYSSGVVSQGNQGRYLQPGIAAWAAILAIGIMAWLPARFHLRAALSSTSIMALVATVCLFGYFYPAFHPLELPDQIAKPLDIRYGDSARLIGMSPANPSARPGETITISLYWEAIQPTERDQVVYLHSVDANVVQRDSYPATGNLRSIDWQPGQTWEERYVISIRKRAEPQHAYDLVTGLYDPETKEYLPAIDVSGAEINPVIGRIAIHGPAQPFEPDYRFGDAIGLASPTVSYDGERVETCLRWGSIAPTPLDYQMFVHIVNPDGTIAAQSDFQPLGGQYPTGAWVPGEMVEMCIPLDAPDLQDGWHAAIGLYDLATGIRPPTADRAGQAQPDNLVIVKP